MQQLTDVRRVPAQWRYSVSTFATAAMALGVMFTWLAADRYEEFASAEGSVRQLRLARDMLTAPVVIGVVALFGTVLLYRWASRRSDSSIGMAIAGWVVILGFAAEGVEPFRVGRGLIMLAAIWGVFGIALIRHGMTTVSEQPRWLADVIAVALVLAYGLLVFNALQAFPDVGGFGGGD